MTATNINRQEARHGRYARLFSFGLMISALALPASAENVLQDVRYEAGAGGKVDVILQLAEPMGEVQAFTTDDPPRISIDLPDTRSEFARRRVAVGTGATSAVSAVEAGGRTRVVIDLFRAAAYETRIEGSNLIVSVAGGVGATAAASAANPLDPAKRLATDLAISGVDFRRGEDGAGRIVLTFSGEGAAADLRSEADGIVIDVTNASIPDSLQKRLDVVDFATPVRTIDSRRNAGGARLTVATSGAFESLAYQTGNEYVVEVVPVREAEAANGTIGTVATKRYTGRPVTFNFQDIPVRTVLQLVAEESELNVVASDSVQGNVTLRLVNVPWDQALDIVLRAKSLDMRQDGNVIWVAPQAELAAYEQAKEDARIAIEQRSETITEYIPVNYGNAEDIAKLLTDEAKTGQGGGGGAGASSSRGFLSPRGSISFDRRTNTLLVVDIPKKIEEIKQVVALLDRPVDQVLIEARIVVAQDDFARELGARFGVTGNKDNAYYSGGLEANTVNRNADHATMIENLNKLRDWEEELRTDPDALPPVLSSSTITRGLNVNLPLTNAAGSLALSILNAGYLLDLELSALQTEGRGEVISNPRIITSNQREAVIRQGDEVGYVTISPIQGGSAATPIPNVQFKDVLLELKVTPTITQDGRVFLDMGVKKDEIADFVSTSIGDVPQINTREVNTAVLVESGQTVVIGGVYEIKSREDLTKVPFLGDVPMLGNLFKKRGKSMQKAELLIFVTPRILDVGRRN